jgi:hypothetical protein
MKPTAGMSLELEAVTAAKFGGAFRVTSIPPELKIVQRRERLVHFEIMPRVPMEVSRYTELLKLIKLSPE